MGRLCEQPDQSVLAGVCTAGACLAGGEPGLPGGESSTECPCSLVPRHLCPHFSLSPWGAFRPAAGGQSQSLSQSHGQANSQGCGGGSVACIFVEPRSRNEKLGSGRFLTRTALDLTRMLEDAGETCLRAVSELLVLSARISRQTNLYSPRGPAWASR